MLIPTISIIVPIYNVEKWLSKCINSIQIQTLKELELILIDDGSSDDCSKICDEYAKKDNRILVIHKSNSGVSAARNVGLDITRGKYIGFVDPDDWIEPEMYEEMVIELENTKSQIACCQFDIVHEDCKNEYRDISNAPTGTLPIKEFIKCLFDVPRMITSSNCSKLFCREYITHEYDESIEVAEDNKFLIDYCIKIDKAVCINKIYYHYLKGRQGSASSLNPNKVAFQIYARESIAKTLQKYDRKLGNLAENEYLQYCLIPLCDNSGQITQDTVKKCRKALKNYLRDNLLNFLFNREINKHTKIYLIMISCTNG